VIHKDIKSANIMLLESEDADTAPHPVIIDLGLAEIMDNSWWQKPREGESLSKSTSTSSVSPKSTSNLGKTWSEGIKEYNKLY
jgi:hypothetical protein